jgi:hypothetical protein
MPKTLKWGQEYSVLLDVGAIADAFTLSTHHFWTAQMCLDGSTDFVDATEYVLAVAVQRGRTNQTDQFSPGTCRVLADDRASGRLFDPANTASTYYQGDFDLAPRRAIKVLAGTAELFVGAITDLDITYELPNLSFASIVSADGLYELSRTALTAFTPSSQLTSDRVTAILDRPEVNFSTALRNICDRCRNLRNRRLHRQHKHAVGVAGGRHRRRRPTVCEPSQPNAIR